MRKFVLFAYKVKTFFAMLYAKVHNLPHWRMESPASVLVFKAAAAQETPSVRMSVEFPCPVPV